MAEDKIESGSNGAEDQGPSTDPAASGLAGVLLGIAGQSRSLNERHVHGSIVEQTVKLVEEYVQPSPVTFAEPDTGTLAAGYIDKDGVHVLPSSFFDEYRDAPKYRRGTATLLDLDSFIGHVNRFADDDTVIFADNDRTKPSLTAVLDYHRTGAEGDPRFGKHRSSFLFPLSDEWKAWNEMNKQPMKMADFAAFLEDHITNVMPAAFVQLTEEASRFVDALPNKNIADPAKLMELATGLQIYENSIVREARNLSSGEAVVEFQSEHTDATGQKLSIPSLFVLGIPVFKGDAGYQIIARLRYRKTGGQILFWYELWRTDLVFDDAFDKATDKVATATAKPLLLGRDESKNLG